MNGGCLCAALYGEIDHHSAADIRMITDPEIERLLPKTMMLDFSGVQFMDSSGIGLILGRQRLLSQLGGTVVIKNASPQIRKINSRTVRAMYIK